MRNMEVKKKKNFLPFVWLLLAFAALSLFEHDYLWTSQEHNLFLNTPLFFRQCMEVSGGLLSWAGAWLTQLFYYPVLGAAVLCTLWVMLTVLLQRAFMIPARWMVLTLIPIAMLLITDIGLGYWLYFLKLRGHMFVGTLGMMVVAVLVWVYRLLPKRWWLQIPFMVVTAVVGYPLFGFYALLAVLVMGIASWCLSTKRFMPIMLLAILLIAVVPLAYYYILYHQTPLSNIYWTALPIFVHNGASDSCQYMPYVVMVIWMVVAPLPFRTEESLRADVQKSGKWQRRLGVISLATIVVLTGIVALCWNKDQNFHRELTLRRALEHQDWAAMLTTARTTKGEPTRAICMMKNLALQRTGRLLRDQGSYPDGFCRPKSPFPIHTVHTVGKALYLQFGLPNYCYRWCMEDGVEYGWTAEGLKLMVKCSLLNGETMAAQQYLSLLKKTLFHRQWARRFEAYVRQPRLITEDAELRNILPLLRNDNFLTSDQSQLEIFLIEQLASSPGSTAEQRELATFCYKLYMNLPKYAERN